MTDVVVEVRHGAGWVPVLRYADLVPGRGVAVLLGDEQVALFRDRDGHLHAVGNRDPFSGAQIMSRGLLGSRGTTRVVASPMYKQVFDLSTGTCLDEPTAPDGTPARLPVWRVRTTPPFVPSTEGGPSCL
ncbi:nitrite reductase (NAD(P)H) small subunit [Streptomyces sp. NBC_00566]|uniref:nitrite reductase (NAD(P)H) small subunit n=1 Tax=Streptomyces sp. NBC_00566 TaxID=2975778 RepID=UPI002E7FCE27|nr:nitrite reductase (NAD(P)H) small subunit [Streptomyces sp. NBC_00566]WUB85536.1 nitrite reductase (NAD(P)H) small subunit [Streptomyces sp. NBC_00566]